MSCTKLDAPHTTFSIQGELHDKHSTGASKLRGNQTSTTLNHATKPTASRASYPNKMINRQDSNNISPPKDKEFIQAVGSISSQSSENGPSDSGATQAKQGKSPVSTDGPGKREDKVQSESSPKDGTSRRHNSKRGGTSETPAARSRDEMNDSDSTTAVQNRMLRAWKAWRESQGYAVTENHIDPSTSTIRFISSGNESHQRASMSKDSSDSRRVPSPEKTNGSMLEKADSPSFQIRKHLVDPHKDQPPH